MSVHVLDRPVWNALVTRWAGLAVGGAKARRLDPAYGLFAAASDDSDAALAALAELVTPGAETWLLEMHEPPTPPGTRLLRRMPLLQMVCPRLTPISKQPADFVELGDADAPQMRELARLTKPGPFERQTHRFGGFVGVRESGRLVAMAGTRMMLPGYREVSAVCTHPDHRGKGHAGALMRTVCQRMLDDGDTPILHTYAANTGANALYQALGFVVRSPITLSVLAT